MVFTAIDVETANPKLSSICQIGIAVFEGEKLWMSGSSWLIRRPISTGSIWRFMAFNPEC